MQTRKLYYEDSHLAAFSARVLSCTPTEKGYEVVLDATAFYPEGGGQAADTGYFGGVRVLDTRERGETVVHLCEQPLEPGSRPGQAGSIHFWRRMAGRARWTVSCACSVLHLNRGFTGRWIHSSFRSTASRYFLFP